MVDFKKIGDRKPVTKSLIVKLEIELTDSMYTVDEAAQKVQYMIDSSRSKEFSELIVFLLRTTRSSMWELHKLEIF